MTRLVLKREIYYPWKSVGFFAESCRCMSEVLSYAENMKIQIVVIEDLTTHTFVAEIKQIPHEANSTTDPNLIVCISSRGKSAQEAYMTARKRFLGCECDNPPNELYDLGYPRPTIWARILSYFDRV